jgi:hypothetical protein
VLAALALSGCGISPKAARPKVELRAQPVAARVLARYPSVGVTLVAVRRGYRPPVSRRGVTRLLRASHLALADSRPSVRLQAVQNTKGAYPAWVFTYHHTRPISYGFGHVVGRPVCTSVVIYDLARRVWTWRFQSCPQGRHVTPSCDTGCTPMNQDALDAAADEARKIAGAYYTGVVVSAETNSDRLYLAHAPQSVLDRLNAAHPGTYVIHNDAPRPLSAVMHVMHHFSFHALDPEGITIAGLGPTQDGYLRVEVTSRVAEAQAKLDAKYGPGIIKVVHGDLATAI